MTLNLWNYTPPWPQRRKIAADLIARHTPDVVALQESRHDFRFERGRGQGEQLAELTGYHPSSAVAQVYIPILRLDEGLTILTRTPPLDVAVCRLTRYPHDRLDENRRICLGITIEHDGRRVHVFDTHFSLSAEARLGNATEAYRFLDERAGHDPAILMGDLNAEPGERSIRILVGDQAVDGQEGDLLDCWATANPSDPGYTYSSSEPVRRIDYVLARNLPPGPISASVLGDESVNGVFASDHLGIVADLPL